MSLNVIKKVIDLGDGRTIEIETGKLAKQADGSVVIKMGDTMLLATVVSTVEAKEGVDFLPLSVDYQEKYAATGRIPGWIFYAARHVYQIMKFYLHVYRPRFAPDVPRRLSC